MWNRPLHPFRVVVHLNGRHPYLTTNELDYETRDVELTVPAKHWNHAEKVAMQAVRGLKWWSASVKSITSGATE
jgi:hypothetical protein